MRICTDIRELMTKRVKKTLKVAILWKRTWTSASFEHISSNSEPIESFILRYLCVNQGTWHTRIISIIPVDFCLSVTSESSMIMLRHCGAVEIWISPNVRSTLGCGTISRFPVVFFIAFTLVFLWNTDKYHKNKSAEKGSKSCNATNTHGRKSSNHTNSKTSHLTLSNDLWQLRKLSQEST